MKKTPWEISIFILCVLFLFFGAYKGSQNPNLPKDIEITGHK